MLYANKKKKKRKNRKKKSYSTSSIDEDVTAGSRIRPRRLHGVIDFDHDFILYIIEGLLTLRRIFF
jgi:hypothetical protein